MLSPRFQGMQEHLSRAAFLLETARSISDAIATYRLQLAAVYSCRAVVELMMEAADKQEIWNPSEPSGHWGRKELEDYVAPRLPFYSLIEKIRIHDFHRFGVVPPDPRNQELFLGGPIKLVAQKGGAAILIGETGPVQLKSGSSEVKEQRPLLNRDGQFFDDNSASYVTLGQIIEQFIGSAQSLVAEVTKNAA